MNNILTIIPARGGSKRVAGKNKKVLLNKPLVAWSIEQAIALESMCSIVSTDDADIADIARECGITSFMRSAEYATDISSVIDVVFEVLDFYESKKQHFDAVLLLQPTSPFRTTESIKQAIALFEKGGGESVVSVSLGSAHPHWCKTVENGVLMSFSEGFDASVRSQDLPDVYQLNGSIYLSSVENLKRTQSFYSENTQALIIDSEEETLDIDTPFDWLVAEAIAKKIKDDT